MTHEKQQKHRHHARGFTLIEVLVALVVITVGMLGVAVLYVEGLQLNRTSLYRTTAVALAADMAEKIRSNRDAGYAGIGPGADRLCDQNNCTPDELADEDWFAWRQSIDKYLPGGTVAEIDRTPEAGPCIGLCRFDIRLQWPEIGSPEKVSYTLTVQL